MAYINLAQLKNGTSTTITKYFFVGRMLIFLSIDCERLMESLLTCVARRSSNCVTAFSYRHVSKHKCYYSLAPVNIRPKHDFVETSTFFEVIWRATPNDFANQSVLPIFIDLVDL